MQRHNVIDFFLFHTMLLLVTQELSPLSKTLANLPQETLFSPYSDEETKVLKETSFLLFLMFLQNK